MNLQEFLKEDKLMLIPAGSDEEVKDGLLIDPKERTKFESECWAEDEEEAQIDFKDYILMLQNTIDSGVVYTNDLELELKKLDKKVSVNLTKLRQYILEHDDIEFALTAELYMEKEKSIFTIIKERLLLFIKSHRKVFKE